MAGLVVHCKRDRYDVYVGRPSVWGNPFKSGSRSANIADYERWIRRQPKMIERAKRELRGKVLGCWCAPLACHADVLARIANGPIRVCIVRWKSGRQRKVLQSNSDRVLVVQRGGVGERSVQQQKRRKFAGLFLSFYILLDMLDIYIKGGSIFRGFIYPDVQRPTGGVKWLLKM